MAKISDQSITVVFFSCFGREHLLLRTLDAFEKYHDNTLIKERILAFDGPLDRSVDLAKLKIDRLINNCQRQGYVKSIRSAFRLVTTEYVFWQEDDCRFVRDCQMDFLKSELVKHPNWVQVGWGIGKKFPEEEKISPLGIVNMYKTAYGFSARPALCRIWDLREAFEDMEANSTIKKSQGFETYVREWLKKKSKISVSVDPGEQEIYIHDGELESTSREYHSVGSSQVEIQSYISEIGGAKLPPLWRRFKLAADLFFSCLILMTSQFFARRKYDVAWRVVRVERSSRK